MDAIQESIGKVDRKEIFVDAPECECDLSGCEQVYHRYAPAPIRITVELRYSGNTVKVSGKSVDEVISLLRETVNQLQAEF